MYEIPLIEGIEGCVYKLSYAGKYVIVKCKTLWRSKQNIESSLQYFIKGTPLGRSTKNSFYKFFSFILDQPGQCFCIDILLSSNNPYQLLKAEFLELVKAKGDPNCLNKYFEPYIPQKTNKKGDGSWINKGYYLNYMNWKRKFANTHSIR